MRGDFGEGNPWQYPMGKATQPVLEAMDVTCLRSESPEEVVATVAAALTMVFQAGPRRGRAVHPEAARRQEVLRSDRRWQIASQPAATWRAPLRAGFVLDRRRGVPALIGRHQDFLIVTGLAGTSRDIAALTDDGAHIYTMAGAMGGACMIGLGLALARRDKRVLVVTGDGELLMNIGSLATIAVHEPAQPVDRLRRQRPLRRDRLPEEPHQPRRRSGEDRGRLRHQAHPHDRERRPRSPAARA